MSRFDETTIVGGGIAGLAAAYYLRHADPNRRITLLDASNRLGGKIVTDRERGYVIEGGPDAFLASKPQGVALAAELGIDRELEGSTAETRRTFVLRGRQLHPMPEGLSGLVPARLEPIQESSLFSDDGKRRFALEEQIAARTDDTDESLASFMERRFGDEIYRRLIEPLMSGIYAGDGDELSLAATFPQLREMERSAGSVLRAIRARPPAAPSGRATGFLTPRLGMQRLVEALTAGLHGVRIVYGAHVKAVEAAPGGYRLRLQSGEVQTSQSVIAAIPAWVSAEMLAPLDRDLSDALAGIPHVSTATISLGFDAAAAPCELRGHGYIIPRGEGLPVLACTWTSSKYECRAPSGRILLRCFIGRRGQEEALSGSDDDLVSLARAELRERLGITAEPEIVRLFRWPNGMPQYTLGHLERLAVFDQRLTEHPGLALAGAAYRGVGIPDCIASAQSAVAAVT
jgi:protoporphyrinogen/coproporphyrinogen III oxidase